MQPDVLNRLRPDPRQSQTIQGLHKKPFEAPQRSVKIKILVNFYFNIIF